MEKNLLSRSFSSSIDGVKDENGDWTVLVTMQETRQFEGDEPEKKEIKTQCTDSDFESAYATAMNATLEKYSDALDENGGNGLFGDEVVMSEELSSEDELPALETVQEV